MGLLFSERPRLRPGSCWFGTAASLVLLLGLSATAPAQTADTAHVTAANEATAQGFLPYVTMACAAYADCSQTKYLSPGYAAESLTWQQTMQRAAGSRDIGGLISTFESAGFSARIFRNDGTREIVVAIRGSEGNPGSEFRSYVADQLRQAAGFSPRAEDGDWQADFRARFNLKSDRDRLEAQYVAARLLARAVDKVYAGGAYAGYTHVLTGHSLGGSLSLYAGKFVNAQVYAVEPAGNVLSAGERTSSQHIIIADRDPVSDPRMGAVSKIAGSSKFQGQIYTVGLVSDKVTGKDALAAQHDANALVKRTAAIADGSARLWDYRPGQSPLGSTAATTPQRMVAQPTPSTAPSTGFQAPQLAMRGGPGGVSLSRAAAERMPLQIRLEGSYYDSGRLLLMGRPDASSGIDAALLLTSLRLACESSDPFFSLDPDDGVAWSREGRQATEALWERISDKFKQRPNVRRKDDEFSMRTISARRDYPDAWAAIADNYPHLRSKLVFRPEWLAQTRFGEILYRADVLLKELSGGVAVLESGPLRATRVASYVPADARFAARGLLRRYEGGEVIAKPEWQGSRLWFDLKSDATPGEIEFTADEAACKAGERNCRRSALRRILDARGLTGVAAVAPVVPVIAKEGNALDMSRVFPQMFVRRHDHATRTDLSGTDPSQTTLAAEVNRRIENYVDVYKELRALTDIFRAYVSAVQITRQEPAVCRTTRSQPLLESEKVGSALPGYHPTELFFTLTAFEYSSGRQRFLLSNRGSSLNGGVSIGARDYMAQGLKTEAATEITRLINANGTAVREESAWQADDKRRFLAFNLDIPKAPAVSGGSPNIVPGIAPGIAPSIVPSPPTAPRPASSPDDVEIENEPAPARLPDRLRR